MTLSNARVNTVYVVTEIIGTTLKRRLLDMGFAPGSKVRALRIAPFGDTVLVYIRGIEIALRKNATDCIVVEVFDEI